MNPQTVHGPKTSYALHRDTASSSLCLLSQRSDAGCRNRLRVCSWRREEEHKNSLPSLCSVHSRRQEGMLLSGSSEATVYRSHACSLSEEVCIPSTRLHRTTFLKDPVRYLSDVLSASWLLPQSVFSETDHSFSLILMLPSLPPVSEVFSPGIVSGY